MTDAPKEPDSPLFPCKPPFEGLVDCGLDESGFTVVYDDECQGHQIFISQSAGATLDNLQRIWDATWVDFVRFADSELQAAYDELTRVRFAPAARQAMREYLELHPPGSAEEIAFAFGKENQTDRPQ